MRRAVLFGLLGIAIAVNGCGGSSGGAGNGGSGGESGKGGSGGANPTGGAGTSGSAGTSGGAGTSGNAGASGSAGTSGGAGSSGNAGTSGSAGSSGNAGTSGSAGSSGVAGSTGAAGVTGSAGTGGSAGSNGNAGGGGGAAGAGGNAGTTGSGGAGGAPSDGGLVCGDDQGSSRGDGCNLADAGGPCVTPTFVTTSSGPTPAGGTLVAGTYNLISDVYFGPADAAAPTPGSVRQTLVFSNVTASSLTLDQVSVSGTASNRSHGTVTFSGTTVTYTSTCPATDAGGDQGGSASYTSATSGSSTLFMLIQDHNGWTEVSTFTKA